VEIYNFVMICPAPEHAVSVNTQPSTPNAPKGPQVAEGTPHTGDVVRRLEYTVENRKAAQANGFAIQLPGLAPQNVVALGSPPGWKASIWYRERELDFDLPAPEVVLDPAAMTFAGVLWRCEEGGINQGASLGGFVLDLEYPLPCSGQGEADEWHLDPLGHAVVLHSRGRSTTAWHVSATTPRRIDLNRRMVEEFKKQGG
jgi:hypothetical protein